jgi:nucleoside-diphosphate-sugar epimerase
MATDTICAITGASGYLGRQIAAHLAARGIRVVPMARQAIVGQADHIPFDLGTAVDPEDLHRRSVAVLIHCAYDFRQRSGDDIRRVNVEGSSRLFETAVAGGVRRIIFLSSMSAFPGCKSRYGQGKLALEPKVLDRGGVVLRPGLVFGAAPGGMFALLDKAVAALPVLPAIGGGAARLHLVWDQDLCRLIGAIVAGEVAMPRQPLIVAHPDALTFADILRRIARRQKKRRVLVPVPWQVAWLGLALLEKLAPGAGLRSDSIVSLMSQEDRPRFDRSILDRIGMTSLDEFVDASSASAEAFTARPSHRISNGSSK